MNKSEARSANQPSKTNLVNKNYQLASPTTQKKKLHDNRESSRAIRKIQLMINKSNAANNKYKSLQRKHAATDYNFTSTVADSGIDQSLSSSGYVGNDTETYRMKKYVADVGKKGDYKTMIAAETVKVADVGKNVGAKTKINPKIVKDTSGSEEADISGRKYKTQQVNEYWPFVLRVEGKWDEDPRTVKNRNMELRFSNSAYGYTVKVEGASAYTASDNPQLSSEFGMEHDKLSNVEISGEAKRLGSKTDADAMTKVLSEGARWKAVAALAASGNLYNDSAFFLDGLLANQKPWYVLFKDLWICWGKAFENAWDIDDATFRTKLASGATKKLKNKRKNDKTTAVLRGASKNYAIPV